jgi:hypothetical protein
MRYRGALGLALVALAACSATGGGADPTAQARELLTAWLVRRDLPAARRMISDRFVVLPPFGEAERWPPALRSYTGAERFLQFPFACAGFPRRCETLAACVRSPPGTGDAEPFAIESLKVTRDRAAGQPALLPFKGETLQQATFILRGCNVGGVVVLRDEGKAGMRAVTIFFLAG